MHAQPPLAAATDVEAEPPQQRGCFGPARARAARRYGGGRSRAVEGGGEGGGDGAAVEMAATSTIRMDGSFNSPLVAKYGPC